MILATLRTYYDYGIILLPVAAFTEKKNRRPDRLLETAAHFWRMSFNVVGSSTSFVCFSMLNSVGFGISFNFLIASAVPLDVNCAAIGSPTLTRESIFVSAVTRI